MLAALILILYPSQTITTNDACPSCVIITTTYPDGDTIRQRLLKRPQRPVPYCASCLDCDYLGPVP